MLDHIKRLQNAKRSKQQSGMTLIEVLIASVILFVAIGTVAGVHRFLLHYQKLNELDYVLIHNQASFIDYVTYSLENDVLQGEFAAGEHVINWDSRLVKQGDAVGSFDPELSDQAAYSMLGSVYLYNVNFSFERNPEKSFDVKILVKKPAERIPGL